MRKLKLQMQTTLDGFVAGPEGQLDWMWVNGLQDAAVYDKVIELADSCDTILLGRKMTGGFIDHWEKAVVVDGITPERAIAERMVNMRKIVFSHTETAIAGKNVEVENGDLATVIRALKNQPGKDIMAYGGADFASSLISLNLVDEYYFFVNPVTIGKGLSIFNDQKILKLESSVVYKSGKILNKYLAV